MRTATISLALDDATPENGCIKFVVGSHKGMRFCCVLFCSVLSVSCACVCAEKEIRRHYPMKLKDNKPKKGLHVFMCMCICASLCLLMCVYAEGVRDDVHTLVTDVDEQKEPIAFAPVKRGGASVHDERIVHGSGGNKVRSHKTTHTRAHTPHRAKAGAAHTSWCTARPRVFNGSESTVRCLLFNACICDCCARLHALTQRHVQLGCVQQVRVLLYAVCSEQCTVQVARQVRRECFARIVRADSLHAHDYDWTVSVLCCDVSIRTPCSKRFSNSL